MENKVKVDNTKKPLTDEEKRQQAKALILEKYDANHDGKISDEELEVLVKDFEKHSIKDKKLLKTIEKFDTNHDGKLDTEELKVLRNDLDLLDGAQRYAGYSAAFARAFRYLAFTSDFGEALRPVLASRIVTATYAVSIGYCFVDVGWEAYKLKQRGYVTENNEKISMAKLVVERSVFQAVASIFVPFAVIHTTVDVSKHVFRRMGRFTRWGPSIVGLSVIPFLPLYLDHPVEHGIEWVFERYGPWAKKSHAD